MSIATKDQETTGARTAEAESGMEKSASSADETAAAPERLSITLPNQVVIRAAVVEPPSAPCIALCTTDDQGGVGELNEFVFGAAGLDPAEHLSREFTSKVMRVDDGKFPILIFPTVFRSYIGNTALTRGLLLRGLLHSLQAIDNSEQDIPIWMTLMGTGSGRLAALDSLLLIFLALATRRFRRSRTVLLSLDKREEFEVLQQLSRGFLQGGTHIEMSKAALEPHVAEALQWAQHMAGDNELLDGSHLLRSILQLNQTRRSEAFTAFAEMVPVQLPEEEAFSGTSSTVGLTPWLYMSWCLSQVHVIRGKGDLWGRDLITLLLLSADPALEQMLSRIRLTPATVRSRWREFISDSPVPYTPEDWDDWWRDAGYLQESSLPTRTGYSAENTTTQDQLDVERDAKAFARLVADKNTIPPLSIGLMGDWGSGKSFFMNLIQKQVDGLKGQSGYCDEIRQIPFNAWHMLDSNLWASLVGHIFEKLLPRGGEEDDELARKLEEAHGAVAEAEKELKTAEATVDNAREELEDAEERLKFPQFAHALGDTIATEYAKYLEGDPESMDHADLENLKRSLKTFKKQFEELRSKAEDLGFSSPESILDLDKLREKTEAARGTWRSVVNTFPKTPWPRITLFALVGAGSLGFLVASPSAIEGIPDFLAELLRNLGAGIAVFGSVLGSATALINSASRVTNNFLTEIDSARASSRPLINSNASLKRAYDSHDRLVKKLADAKEHLSDLERQKKEIASGERLRSFIEERARSSDYTSKLGLISLVREDFSKLEHLMKQREAASNDNQSVETQFKVERIVLYIDDLDRCPPKRVVEMLEAIHLLLSFKLFIVIVAVDSRWLLRSLEVHYQDLLLINGDQASGSSDYRHTTPQNYLEKIFQVTYALSRMKSDAFANYMTSLAESGSNVAQISDTAAQERTLGLYIEDSVAAGQDKSATPVPEMSTIDGDGESTRDAEVMQEQAVSWDAMAGQGQTNPLIITRSEREALGKLYQFLDTPRQAKRVINVYRLLKAPLTLAERNALEDSRTGHYTLVLLLLAILYGRPNVANLFFRKLYESTPFDKDVPVVPNSMPLISALDTLVSEHPLKAAELEALRDEVQAIELELFIREDSRTWIGRIGRFSLLTGPDWHTWKPYKAGENS